MPIPLVTRILVADDHPIVRSGLKKVLDAQPDLEVVGVFNPGVIRFQNEVILLLRVSEAPRKVSPSIAAAPISSTVRRSSVGVCGACAAAGVSHDTQ